MKAINKKILLEGLKIVAAMLIGGGIIYIIKINIPINSNNNTYRIYAQQAFVNDNGQLTINGVIKNTVTGDSVTFASQGVVELNMQKIVEQ